MNKERIYQVLRSPHVSEKASVVGDAANQVIFKVAGDASKHEIAEAVAALFDVKVESVTTLNNKPKQKRFRGQPGARSGFKKAYVTLADGDEIDFLDGAAQ
ncbi:50S ribosomal protein L23 [Salinisphaera hydrothermalis]|uniref:Large ribosomal subunit protein uL23 n=1 Tax=Salinisphaera hydrothermalis (strain C41B8) TaxID=1304275 RepID=A0A084IGR6_SALHC|nr:50S ribosomal protein L23 [Salinisphaera hydrothermalis]KEZ75900.1 50S ribosomal protein L23 [Salinisphaera hydrothermalis C41B8]